MQITLLTLLKLFGMVLREMDPVELILSNKITKNEHKSNKNEVNRIIPPRSMFVLKLT